MTRTNDGQKQVTFIEIAGGKRVPFQGRKCAWYQPAQAKLLRDTIRKSSVVNSLIGFFRSACSLPTR